MSFLHLSSLSTKYLEKIKEFQSRETRIKNERNAKSLMWSVIGMEYNMKIQKENLIANDIQSKSPRKLRLIQMRPILRKWKKEDTRIQWMGFRKRLMKKEIIKDMKNGITDQEKVIELVSTLFVKSANQFIPELAGFVPKPHIVDIPMIRHKIEEIPEVKLIEPKIEQPNIKDNEPIQPVVKKPPNKNDVPSSNQSSVIYIAVGIVIAFLLYKLVFR